MTTDVDLRNASSSEFPMNRLRPSFNWNLPGTTYACRFASTGLIYGFVLDVQGIARMGFLEPQFSSIFILCKHPVIARYSVSAN